MNADLRRHPVSSRGLLHASFLKLFVCAAHVFGTCILKTSPRQYYNMFIYYGK